MISVAERNHNEPAIIAREDVMARNSHFYGASRLMMAEALIASRWAAAE